MRGRGDLIIGARKATALITLSERCSRTQRILNLPGGYTAERVAERLDTCVATMPHDVLSSLSWDRGSEMAQWANLRASWGLGVCFADAHSPCSLVPRCQGNRRLRFFLPKSTDLAVHSQDDLDAITDVLNRQPPTIT